MMKHLFRNSALAAAALAAGLATTTVPAVAADEIVIGLSYGRTGIYSSINKTTEVAVDIAVEEINSAGGINGKQVRIVKFDTPVTPSRLLLRFANLPKTTRRLP